jgi:hypothetical protein
MHWGIQTGHLLGKVTSAECVAPSINHAGKDSTANDRSCNVISPGAGLELQARSVLTRGNDQAGLFPVQAKVGWAVQSADHHL